MSLLRQYWKKYIQRKKIRKCYLARTRKKIKIIFGKKWNNILGVGGFELVGRVTANTLNFNFGLTVFYLAIMNCSGFWSALIQIYLNFPLDFLMLWSTSIRIKFIYKLGITSNHSCKEGLFNVTVRSFLNVFDAKNIYSGTSLIRTHLFPDWLSG